MFIKLTQKEARQLCHMLWVVRENIKLHGDYLKVMAKIEKQVHEEKKDGNKEDE